MRGPIKKVYDLANNPWFIIIAGTSSIIALAGWLFEKFDPNFSRLTNAKMALDSAIAYAGEPGTILLVVLSTFFLLGFIYSIRVRWENMSLRKMSQIFYEINLLYKQELQQNFLGDDPTTDPRALLDAERRTLTAVCQRIARIFTMAIGRPCLVTVKLTIRENGEIFAKTYVRSEDQCLRDNNGPGKFTLGTGENSGFDAATRPSADARPSHFFSSDLSKEKNYSNQRQYYIQNYKSVLVVPIRGILPQNAQSKMEADLVGFLTVDTMSTNRLNDRYHLYMLAALSHQMYNFISLMRGRYTVFVGA